MKYKHNKIFSFLLTLILLLSVGTKEITVYAADLTLKDDFYEAVNKEWLESTKIPSGEMGFDTLAEMSRINDQRIQKILDELSAQTHPKGSINQKLSDFYTTILDMDTRNAQRLAPVQKYLDAYENAASLSELIAADLFAYSQTGTTQLLNFSTYMDAKDNSVNVLYLENLPCTWTKSEYSSETFKKPYIEYLTTLLITIGETKEQAVKDAHTLFDFEKILAEASLDPQDLYDISKTYTAYNLKELDALYSHLDIASILKEMGYSTPSKIIIQDKNRMEKALSYINEDNLELLKLYAKAYFVTNFSYALSEDFQENKDKLFAEIYGIEGTLSNAQRATLFTQEHLPVYLEQIYIDRYFSSEIKQDVESMISDFITVYEKKIHSADWMSKITQEKAIKKLKMIDVKVGYPDTWSNRLDNVQIISSKNGGSFFENISAISRANAQQDREQLGKLPDKSKWEMSVFTANAYYHPYKNEIVFPAGILQPPLYDPNASKAWNLGAIGSIIAHEISHAFDNNGSPFDEKGNANEWWTPEDHIHFTEKCEDIISAYDGIEVSHGIKNNGTLTLMENIADLGGVGCALEVLSQGENPDYQSFFKAWATTWRSISTPEFLEYLSENDVHSLNKVRANRTVANFEAFYKAFNITKDDGMYIPVEERVSLW